MTLDHHHVAGSHFLHILHLEIEACHQRSSLRSKRDDLVVLEIETRPDSRGIARHKGITITRHAANRVTAVPFFRRTFEDAGQIEIHADMVGHLIAGHAVVAQIAVEIDVLLIEVVADFFEHGLGVRRVNRMLAHRGQRGIELRRIGQREIAAEREIPRGPGAAAKVRMTGRRIVITARAIAQVAHEQLAAEIERLVHRVRKFGMNRAGGDMIIILLEQRLEDPVQRIGLNAPLAKHVGLARRHVHFHTSHARAVLTPVVLLLHQEEELGESPQWVPVFFLVVGQRLQEPHHRYAAFVGDFFTHGFKPLRALAFPAEKRRCLDRFRWFLVLTGDKAVHCVHRSQIVNGFLCLSAQKASSKPHPVMARSEATRQSTITYSLTH